MIFKYQFLYMNENISVNLRTVNAKMSKQTKFIERRVYLSLQASVLLSSKRWVLFHSVHGDQIRLQDSPRLGPFRSNIKLS